MGESPRLEPNRPAGWVRFVMVSTDVTGEKSGTRGALPPEDPPNPKKACRSRFAHSIRRKKLDPAVPSIGDERTV